MLWMIKDQTVIDQYIFPPQQLKLFREFILSQTCVNTTELLTSNCDHAPVVNFFRVKMLEIGRELSAKLF